jgi:hypothetical protein
MKKRFKILALVTVSLAVLVTVGTQLSFITVTNHSGKPLTGVAVLSEAFSLSCGSLLPNQSRWFVRWARGSCGVSITGQHNGQRFSSGAGFIISDSHGYRIRIALQPDYSFRLAATPEPLINLPAIVSTQ